MLLESLFWKLVFGCLAYLNFLFFGSVYLDANSVSKKKVFVLGFKKRFGLARLLHKMGIDCCL